MAKKINNFTDEGYQWKNYLIYKNRLEQDNKEDSNVKVRGYSEVIEFLKEMPYEEYLLTKHWKHFSSECVKFFGKCVICDSKNNLKIHHKTYKNRGRETFNDVICLCIECHKKVHQK